MAKLKRMVRKIDVIQTCHHPMQIGDEAEFANHLSNLGKGDIDGIRVFFQKDKNSQKKISVILYDGEYKFFQKKEN